jgi:cyclopropane fatty-acyl-phospholipid synthase-like methyltransferase
MGDRWFEIASADHFWVRRRFEVLQKLAGTHIPVARNMAEVGCGHGLLQRQIEMAYHRDVTGFDLNEYALQRNVSERSRVCCYDIFQMALAMQKRFDLIFLFDVLEHIENEHEFLKALRFHLQDEGRLIINVPAGQWAYSRYDTAAGHVRRYSPRGLCKVLANCGFQTVAWTYWGLPLAPTLLLRKVWLAGRRHNSDIIASGFDARSSWMNASLARIARCEPIPQKLLGTSLMAVFS